MNDIERSIAHGERLRLRDDAYPSSKVREWIFEGEEDDGILLTHEVYGYTWPVKRSEIDWDEYRRRKKRATQSI